MFRGITGVVAVVLAFAAAPAQAAPAKLVATVGPGETITLKTARGALVRTLKPGLYTITVRDRSEDHDFRLSGPGVRKSTSVGFVGTTTWKVRLRAGSYSYICGPHSDEMRGAFRVR